MRAKLYADTFIEHERFADDLVVLIDAHPRHEWLMKEVKNRLRGEIAKLQVQINEEKNRIVMQFPNEAGCTFSPAAAPANVA